MMKALGSLLAALMVLQGALPSLGFPSPEVNIIAVITAMGVAGLTFFLRSDSEESTNTP